jgi:hypothetical protein
MGERVTNVHGQGRFVNGNATGETFLDLGPLGSNGYIKVETFVDPEFPGHITIGVREFAKPRAGVDLPRIRLVVQGTTYADLPFHPDGV